ncbi:MAG TPA: ornithine cyclodeaminase family protein [Burkholderiales bacterium]|nr:ornithine cyclodeaminase family protein [Burkholderiales bacterium]
MAVTLGRSALEGAIAMSEAIDLLEDMLRHEASGRTATSPKYVTDFKGGSMRILFAADYEAGYCATKAYHVIQGAGVRYIVTLYRHSDGEVLAILDGSVITDLRTGAASGVAARRVAVSEPVSVGVVGSGNQARMQLESIAAVYRIATAAVYSPTQENREAFASDMSAKLGFPVQAAASAQDAVHGRSVVVTASNARTPEPIVLGAWLGECRLLCAVGNTRAQFSELDMQCFADAALIVADTEHAFHEAGEFRRASEAGVLPAVNRATLAQLVSGAVRVPREGLVVFKSVGSALQDLALASRYYERLGERGVPTAPDLGRVR